MSVVYRIHEDNFLDWDFRRVLERPVLSYGIPRIASQHGET
jgi:hypothetical protein